jgi:hypothetical protein
MKIEIKCEDNNITLSNENLDNNNFIDIEGDFDTQTVPLNELESAVRAFQSLKRLDRANDKMLE